MASGLLCVVVALALTVVLAPSVSGEFSLFKLELKGGCFSSLSRVVSFRKRYCNTGSVS